MGDKKAAKGILEQLREKYPKSKEAELAKRKLEDMNKKASKEGSLDLGMDSSEWTVCIYITGRCSFAVSACRV